MTDTKIEVALPVTEVTEVVPEVPTTEPPTDIPAVDASVIEEKPVEEAAAAAVADAEAVVAPEEKKEKKSGGVARRFTFTKKWGKHRDEAAVPKEPEAPKDAKEDVLGWLAQQIPQAVHKANYQVLDFVQKTAIDNEEERKPIPGKDQSTTRNQFLSFIRDGDLLVKFANSLQAGAVEPVVAEENADAAAQKEVQKKNLDSFAEWANGVIGNEGMKSEDLLEKGKAGYSAVFQTLWQLGLQAKEKFEKDGFDAETIVTLAGQAVKSGLLNTILGFFRRNRQATVDEVKEGEGAVATTEGDKPADVAVVTEEVIAEPVAVKVETSAPAAVAAN